MRRTINVQPPLRAANARAWFTRPQDKADKELRPPQVFNARSDDPSHVDVWLYDEIGMWGIDAASFVAALNADAKDAKNLTVHINSPGGDVWDGIAIMNAIALHPANVVVQVEGLAASAASYIALAGDEVIMAPHTQMMIHDASGVAYGNAADLRGLADLLDQISDNIASMYQEKAGGTVAGWRDLMKAETWYSAEEAVKAGLADRVLELDKDKASDAENLTQRLTAMWDLSVFQYAGRNVAPTPAEVPAPAPEPKPEPEPISFSIGEVFRAATDRAARPLTFDPAVFRAAVEVAANTAPAPPVVKPRDGLTPDRPEPLGAVDPVAFYEAIRKAKTA